MQPACKDNLLATEVNNEVMIIINKAHGLTS